MQPPGAAIAATAVAGGPLVAEADPAGTEAPVATDADVFNLLRWRASAADHPACRSCGACSAKAGGS